MSAKINVETDNPALAAVLGMVIATAIEKAGFTTTRAKTVMLSQIANRPERVEELGLQKRLPPELKPLNWTIPTPEFNAIDMVVLRNQGILDNPVVLSFYPDTCEKYEKDVQNFLGVSKEVDEPKLEGKHVDTLVALVEFGPCWCGDVPSKTARDDLIKWGYAIDTPVKGEQGYHAATYLGVERYRKLFGGDTMSEAIKNRKAGKKS